MTLKTIAAIAKPLRAKIGAHARLIGASYDADAYHRARADSDLAAQQAKYLTQYLADSHAAVQFAHAVGMPGYINMR